MPRPTPNEKAPRGRRPRRRVGTFIALTEVQAVERLGRRHEYKPGLQCPRCSASFRGEPLADGQPCPSCGTWHDHPAA